MLVRALGRWDLTASVINAVVGSAIFGMPAAVAALTGSASPLAVLGAGAAILPVVLCFAEVGSRFDAAGGPYLYARTAFGPAAGFQIGWLLLWIRLLSAGAVLNVMTSYLAALVPAIGTPLGRALTMIAAVALVTVINVRGVRRAAWTVNLLTVAKLLPLLLVAALGLARLDRAVLAAQRVPTPQWADAVLLLVFAYGGFEAAVVAGSESRRPREDTAFALVAAMLGITGLYAAVQLAIVGTLPDAARATAPVADALRGLLGPVGTAIGAGAAALSTYAWLTGFALMLPRVPFAMAERGELPALLARVHPEWRTPHVAIVASSAAALALGLAGSFAASATLSAVARLVLYAVVAASLVALRRRERRDASAVAAPGAASGAATDAPIGADRGGDGAVAPAGFRLPGGPLVAALAIATTLALLATRPLAQAWGVLAIGATGAAVWALGARRGGPPARPDGEDGPASARTAGAA